MAMQNKAVAPRSQSSLITGKPGELKVSAHQRLLTTELAQALCTQLQNTMDLQRSTDLPLGLAELDVSQNKIPSNVWEDLFTSILPGVLVRRLRLYGCPSFDDQAAEALAHFLRSVEADAEPTELHLSDCAITTEGFNHLMEALELNAAFPAPSQGKEDKFIPLYIRLENNYIDEAAIQEKVDAGILELLRKGQNKKAEASPNVKARLVVGLDGKCSQRKSRRQDGLPDPGEVVAPVKKKVILPARGNAAPKAAPKITFMHGRPPFLPPGHPLLMQMMGALPGAMRFGIGGRMPQPAHMVGMAMRHPSMPSMQMPRPAHMGMAMRPPFLPGRMPQLAHMGMAMRPPFLPGPMPRPAHMGMAMRHPSMPSMQMPQAAQMSMAMRRHMQMSQMGMLRQMRPMLHRQMSPVGPTALELARRRLGGFANRAAAKPKAAANILGRAPAAKAAVAPLKRAPMAKVAAKPWGRAPPAKALPAKPQGVIKTIIKALPATPKGVIKGQAMPAGAIKSVAKTPPQALTSLHRAQAALGKGQGKAIAKAKMATAQPRLPMPQRVKMEPTQEATARGRMPFTPAAAGALRTHLPLPARMQHVKLERGTSGRSRSPHRQLQASGKNLGKGARKEPHPPRHGPPLPAGWEEHYDENHKIAYFWNRDTDESVWERP